MKAAAGKGRTLLGLVLLARPHACLTAAAGVLVIAVLADPLPSLWAVAAAAGVVLLITAAGNAVNDRYDLEIDRVNAPGRPLPAGLVSRTQATRLVATLFALGFGLSLCLPAWCVAVTVVNSALLVAYARSGKRWGLAKNLIVGYLVASLFLFAALAFGDVSLLAVVLAGCALLASVAREIVKDVEDLAGDRQALARTLPLVIGTHRSRRVAAALLAAAVLLALVPWALGQLGRVSLVLILLGAVVFTGASLVPRPPTAQRLIMAGSVIELAAFLVAGSR